MASEARVPASVMVSLGLHGGALVLFGLLMKEGPKAAPKVVEGVDLLIQAPKARAAEARPAVKAPPLSTFDFLKMALPTVPHHSVAPAQIKLAEPEHKVKLAAEPKLEDKLKKDLGPKLQPLDMSKEHPIEAQKLDAHVDRHHATQALAALPRLEEVGRRRVKNLPEAVELEDRRREAVAAIGLPDAAAKATSRHQAAAAVQALQEAPQAEERAAETRKGLGSLLPERPLALEERPAQAMVPKIEKPAQIAPRLNRAAAAQAEAPKKGVEIEGPLADRRVTAYSVPPFPDWAKSQGILEADVKIRFTVDENGSVMPGMRVQSSSGYGRLDKLAMDALASWKFAPKLGAGVQWGVITFRFILE